MNMIGEGGDIKRENRGTMAGANQRHQFTVFLGRNIPGGGIVTEEMWRLFEEEVVAKALQGLGFTVTQARGGWSNPDTGELEREDSFVLVVIGEALDEAFAGASTIARHYKRRFRQNQVWITTSKVDLDII